MKEEEILRTFKDENDKRRMNANWICQISHSIRLLKHVTEGKIEGIESEEEDVRSYWMILRKREIAGI
jgi:hypothetical protein